MRHIDLERLVVYSTLSAFGFLAFADLATAPLNCPKCGAGPEEFTLREDPRTSQPYFFCEHVVNPGRRVPTTGRKKGFKTVDKQTCLFSRGWRTWSPMFKEQLPHVQPTDLIRVFWHWCQMHGVEEVAFETDLHPDTVGEVYHWLRDSVTSYMQKCSAREMIGGPGKIFI